MDAFAAAIDDLFADPNIARNAVWRGGGVGDGIPVRVVTRRPDSVAEFEATRVAVETAVFDLRVSEVPELAEGDIAGPRWRDVHRARGAEARRGAARLDRRDTSCVIGSDAPRHREPGRPRREETAAAERAVTAGMSEVSADLKTDLRRQITSAGLGERLACTWRSEVYPRGQKSIGAAGFVWSKAPDIIRAFEQGAVIRSKRGLFLAIPTALAGKLGRGIGGGREKITPQGWERRTGLKLRFVYRRNAPSLLVVDDIRITKGGRVVANVSRRKGVISRRKSGGSVAIVFILVPQVRLGKRLDVASAAAKAARELPGRIIRNWPEIN